MSPPEGRPPGSTGPPDRHTLRLLERHFTDDPLVGETTFEPNHHEPRTLLATLDDDRYPNEVVSARVDVRWFESGDYSFHYVEHRSNGDLWECRWDRHPNEHDTRSHFHRPPDCESTEQLHLDSHHPLEVSSTVLAAIEERLERLWSSAE